MNKQVSVIIPTYKRPDYLDRCIKALLAQNFAPDQCEIIIVDDAASASTQKQVEDWSTQAATAGYTIRYLTVTGPHHGMAPLPLATTAGATPRPNCSPLRTTTACQK